MSSKSALYIIPTFLSEVSTPSLVDANMTIINDLSIFIVENLRTARRHLRAMGYTKNFDTEVTFLEWDKHAKNPISQWFKQIDKKPVGLLSECGTPCVADPGFQVVKVAHMLSIPVFPLVGPNAILLALMGSGFSGQNFTFHGYLPITPVERKKMIKQLEDISRKTGYTQLFMETPFRNDATLKDIFASLNDATFLSVACDLTLPTQTIITQTIAQWKKSTISFNKRYCIYSIGN